MLLKKHINYLVLKTFFTVGKSEVKAWAFKENSTAQQCSSLIHTDISNNFIKAEIYTVSDILKYKSEKYLKINGKIRIEGKNYLVKDNDVCYFRFNKK